MNEFKNQMNNHYKKLVDDILDVLNSVENYQWLINRIEKHPIASTRFKLNDYLKYPQPDEDLDFIPDDVPKTLQLSKLRAFCALHGICTEEYDKLSTWLDESTLPKVNDVFMLNCYYDRNDQQQCGVFKCVKEFTLQDINEHYNPNEDNDTLVADILVKQGYIEKLDIPLITIGYQYTK